MVKGAVTIPMIKGSQKPVKKSLQKLGDLPQLTAGRLKKLGSVSLGERVQMYADKAESPEEAALSFKKGLTKLEHSKLWQQHKTHLKNNPAEAAAAVNVSKKEKGLAAALWFVKTQSPKFINLTTTIGAEDSILKKDEWLSEKQMLTKFSEEEFHRHQESGRILWREDPLTKGVYQYKDQGDISRVKQVSKGKSLTQLQEFQPDQDTDELFTEMFDKDIEALLHEQAMLTTSMKPKGKGLGKGDTSGKNKDTKPLAIEDKKSDEELLEEALSKARKMRELCTSCLYAYEDAERELKASKYYSTALKKDILATKEKMDVHCKQLKNCLVKKTVSLEVVKQACVTAAAQVKHNQGQIKELRQLTHKTASKASSRERKNS